MSSKKDKEGPKIEDKAKAFLSKKKDRPQVEVSSPPPVEPTKPAVAGGDASLYNTSAFPNTQSLLDKWEQDSQDGRVKVTDAEKESYLVAFHHDVPVRWEIALDVLHLIVEIQALTPKLADLAALATMEDVKDGSVADIAAAKMGRLQFYSAFLEVLSINGEPFGLRLNTDLPREELLIQMREAFQPIYRSLSFQKWNALFKAIRIFRTKLDLCDARIDDESFWKPAGIS